mgnify:FL=1
MPEICNTQKIKKDFMSYDKDFRIEAVIHSGQWYTIHKWARLAVVTEQELLTHITNTSTPLIMEQNSYRVDTAEVFRWYNENSLDI